MLALPSGFSSSDSLFPCCFWRLPSRAFAGVMETAGAAGSFLLLIGPGGAKFLQRQTGGNPPPTAQEQE